MKFRSKLLLAQAPLVLALLVIAAAAGAMTQSLGRGAQRILADNYRSVLAAERMKEAIERIDSGALFAVAGEAERGLTQASEHARRFEEELRAQEANITEPGEATLTRDLRRRWTIYRERLDTLRPAADPAAIRATYFDELLPVFIQVKDAADAVLAVNQDSMVRKSEQTRQHADRLRNALVAVALIAFALAVLGTGILTARILRPLGVLGQAARRIGEGDLASRARLTGRDEIARLAHDFNTMADRLQQYRQSSLGELLEAQQASQAAIDSLSDPVLILGIEGDLRHTNQAAAAMLRLDPEAEGAEALRAADPSVRDAVEAVRRHVVGGRGAFTPRGLEDAFPVKAPEGDRHLLPRGSAVYGEGGAIVGVTVVLQDVSRLLRFDELKNNLVATVAHEFRTPLTSLHMAIHLCVEEVVGPLTEKQADLLHAAREDCARLQSIVDELLDLSRIQAGRIQLRPVPLDIERLVQEALEPHRPAAAQRGVDLRSEVLPGTGHVIADPERAHLVFTNLVTNAIRHSPPGTQVIVAATRTGSTVRFTVTDTGPGIPREYHQAIFDRFFRLPGSTTGAAGLGLFIARELIRAHRGDIGVDSEPGQGSTFWFTLPSHDEAAESGHA
jgi:two-component system, NtrC family, sensor histidine kinase KinB